MPLINEPIDVQVVRVRVRAGSGYREMRAKIMPDPERPGQYVIAGRNPQTGEAIQVPAGTRTKLSAGSKLKAAGKS